MKKNCFRSAGLFAGIVFFAATLGGCATLTKGNSQNITIDTKPAGAICTLTRNGKNLGIVNATPGTINVDKSMHEISVVCKKDGFHDCPGKLSPEFQGMTFGNIIFGGLVGLAIDAGSGAMSQYDPMLSLIMTPKEFNSNAERDAFFENLKAAYLQEHSKTIAKMSNTCKGLNDDTKQDPCREEIKATEANKEVRLAEIEKMRTASITK